MEKREDAAPMVPSHYDEDATLIDDERDYSYGEEELESGAEDTHAVKEYDRRILTEEEEREETIQKGRETNTRGLAGVFVRAGAAIPTKRGAEEFGEKSRDGRQKHRQQRRMRRSEKRGRLQADAEHGETRELMYEMEEGGMKEGSSTGSSSDTESPSGYERKRLQHTDTSTKRRRRFRNFCLIHIPIILALMGLTFGAWKLSSNRKSTKPTQSYFNNGTALFAPTTILISLDGFRADFVNRGLTPRLNAFIKEGVSPSYMLPSFPSVTFPNHYTLVTGLYPESHGIVGNSFWDPERKEEFYYTIPAQSMQPYWWGGEPLWVTAEKQGIRTGIHMWPGSEAHILGVEPTFLDKYNGKESLSAKVDRVLELIDKPGMEDENARPEEMRPQLIAAYVPNVDTAGHFYGPNSTEIRTTISEVDRMLDQLFHGLGVRNLTDVVNVVVVSDHGMATSSVDRLIQLEDLIDVNLIEQVDGWPLYGLRPKREEDLQMMYDTLAAKAATNPNFEVYLRDVNMPERYHFSKSQRISPLWLIPKTGWALVTKDEFNVEEGKKKGLVYHPRGIHGYDHEHPLMRALFVARGPAFPHPPNSKIPPFRKCTPLCLSLFKRHGAN